MQTPQVSKRELRRLRSFVRKWLRDNLTPLSVEELPSVEEWLRHANYSQARKAELYSAWEEHGNKFRMDKKTMRKLMMCNSFVKREWYPKPKHARGINSRSDAFKCLTGPYFHAIEDKLFKLPWFVKHVRVPDISRYFMERLPTSGVTYVATDHTSFEAHMTPDILHAVEFQLYAWMWSRLPDRRRILGIVSKALAGKNVCRFKNLIAEVKGCRMSGDMCTSLGNGFTNLMVMLYTCEKRGSKCTGVVEGDDGLFAIWGDVPTLDDFKEVGMTLKLEIHGKANLAGFCGIYCDEKLKENVVDPAEMLVKFGWTMSQRMHGGPKVMKGLLRAKGFSLANEAPTCPIVKSLAKYALRVTEGSKPIFGEVHGQLSWWDARVLEGVDLTTGKLSPKLALKLERPVAIENREVVDQVFGIDRATQLSIEGYLDSLDTIQPLRHPAIMRIMKTEWIQMWDRNVLRIPVGVRTPNL